MAPREERITQTLLLFLMPCPLPNHQSQTEGKQSRVIQLPAPVAVVFLLSLAGPEQLRQDGRSEHSRHRTPSFLQGEVQSETAQPR